MVTGKDVGPTPRVPGKKDAPGPKKGGGEKGSGPRRKRGGGGPGPDRGPGGTCRCTVCGKTVPHQTGVPCNQLRCPDCGGLMARES